jgi:DNA-binding NarL/FixJ family response regulator
VSQFRTDSSFGVSKRRNPESEPTRLSKISVFIAHSDPLISAGLAVLLRKSRKFKVLCFAWERSTLRLAEPPTGSADVVIADYDTGIRLATGAPEWNGRVVILTHSDSQAKICHALAQGVRGYLLLGCSPQDLVAGIRSVHEGGVAVAPRVASRIAECLNQEALTAREQTVLPRMTLGWSNKRIARELGLAVGTVKTHIKGILAKLGAVNRGEAVAIARRRGILPDEIEWQEPWSTRRLCVRKDVSISRRAG